MVIAWPAARTIGYMMNRFERRFGPEPGWAQWGRFAFEGISPFNAPFASAFYRGAAYKDFEEVKEGWLNMKGEIIFGGDDRDLLKAVALGNPVDVISEVLQILETQIVETPEAWLRGTFEMGKEIERRFGINPWSFAVPWALGTLEWLSNTLDDPSTPANWAETILSWWDALYEEDFPDLPDDPPPVEDLRDATKVVFRKFRLVNRNFNPALLSMLKGPEARSAAIETKLAGIVRRLP